GYLTAWLAPTVPMRHVVVVGFAGCIAGSAAALATIPLDLGPDWYPIALAVTAFPSVWIGGLLYQIRHAQRKPAYQSLSERAPRRAQCLPRLSTARLPARPFDG